MSCEPVSHGILDMEPKVPMEVVEDLCKSVTYEEVREVIFMMGNDKVPGPDGYSALFFKKAWCIVGDDVSKALMEFFNNGSPLKQLNRASIALIPKGSHASYILLQCYIQSHFQDPGKPANYCINNVAKAQAAFVKGRWMSDNIHLA
jgi:hypothetical protein